MSPQAKLENLRRQLADARAEFSRVREQLDNTNASIERYLQNANRIVAEAQATAARFPRGMKI